MKRAQRTYQSPDGATWTVDVKLPSHSSALLTFQHAGGQSVAPDRYAWINAAQATVSDPRERLSAAAILDSLGDHDLERLFARSMAVKRLAG